MKGKIIQKVVVSMLVISVIGLLVAPIKAKAQMEYLLFGVAAGMAISPREEATRQLTSNQIYLDVEAAEKIKVEDLRFVTIILRGAGFEIAEGKTLQEVFENHSIVKEQLKKWAYEWVAIWREGERLIFAYILKEKY